MNARRRNVAWTVRVEVPDFPVAHTTIAPWVTRQDVSTL